MEDEMQQSAPPTTIHLWGLDISDAMAKILPERGTNWGPVYEYKGEEFPAALERQEEHVVAIFSTFFSKDGLVAAKEQLNDIATYMKDAYSTVVFLALTEAVLVIPPGDLPEGFSFSMVLSAKDSPVEFLQWSNQQLNALMAVLCEASLSSAPPEVPRFKIETSDGKERATSEGEVGLSPHLKKIWGANRNSVRLDVTEPVLNKVFKLATALPEPKEGVEYQDLPHLLNAASILQMQELRFYLARQMTANVVNISPAKLRASLKLASE